MPISKRNLPAARIAASRSGKKNPIVKRQDSFGCLLCWPDDVDAAWLAFTALPVETKVEDEFHFRVEIARCTACAQRYVSVFTETIDWHDGEDPQYTRVMPVTNDEAAQVSTAEPAAPRFNALAPERRSLHRDFPKEAQKPTNSWGVGLRVRAHG